MRNNAPTILIVEDDERIRNLMRTVLTGAGYATLETHWRIGTQMEDALMVRPQGGGFSAGGEAASRICLDVLHRKYGFGA